MLTNNLKVTIRNIARHKGFSIINIMGLALGMTACILIALWVQDETSYDRMYPNAQNIYRLYRQFDTPDGRVTSTVVPAGLGPTLKGSYPGVADEVTFMNHRFVLSHDEKKFTEMIAVATPTILDIFSIELLRGDKATAMSKITNIVITEELALKYFGDDDPMGKTLQVENWFPATITGIIKKLPKKTTVRRFDAVININLLGQLWGRDMADMEIGNYYGYISIDPAASPKDVQANIAGVIQPYHEEPAGEEGSVNSVKATVLMQPLLRERLHDIEGGGLITYVYIFSGIGLLILLIACFNYMNLSTARSGKRAMEVGIKRVVGASRHQLAKQFFGEALIMSFFAAAVALLLTYTVLPYFNTMAGKELSLTFRPATAILFAAITLLTGIIAGTYPALILSSFRPIAIMKSGARNKTKGTLFRRTLVVAQFSISIFLIIGSMLIYRQLEFIRGRDLGFKTDNVLTFRLSSPLQSQWSSFRQTLLSDPGVTGATRVNAPPVYRESSTGGNNVSWEGKSPDIFINDFGIVGTDPGFIEVFEPEMVTGRFFSEEFPTDMTDGAVINQTALRTMNIDDPIGKTFTTYDNTYRIIGVVKDFHLQSLHTTIKPLVILPNWGIDGICVSLSGENPAETRAFVEATVSQFDPGARPTLEYLDDMRMNRSYGTEQRTETMIKYGTFLAIFISCLGLLGLAAFTAEQRTKEIGIRKVLGSSTSGIILLLSKEFIKWVLIANVVAWPLAWYASRKWLDGFAYKADISIWVFVASSAVALAIAFMIIAWQSWKSARANPIESLKYE
ncbi:MAG: ABC transporter permease [Bacteroidales bacterium]|nr:ABC transporter permease [Candidatus Latescibacterota bacterium]